MTVSSATNYVQYTGDGSTTAFSFPYYFLSSDDIKVQVNDGSTTTTLTLNSDYTVSGAGNSSGGMVTLNTAYSSSYTILLYRYPSSTQETAYAENGKFPAKSHEKALDKLTLLMAKMQWLYSYLTLSRPNFFAKYYDAQSNKISNLLNPTSNQDAATKVYVDDLIDEEVANRNTAIAVETVARKAADVVLQNNIDSEAATRKSVDASLLARIISYFNRSLRVPEGYIRELPSAKGRAKSLLGFNSSGAPSVIYSMTDTADLAVKLAGYASDGEGAGLIGYGIGNSYPEDTVGRKLNYILTPYDFGAVADGTLHALSEYYNTLADAQKVYSFVTSLDQSIDYAALHAWLKEVEARAGCYGFAGGQGRFYVNDLPELNKTYSSNTLSKMLNFSGTAIYVGYGQAILTENNATGFANWTYAGSAAADGDTISFTGNTSTQSKATRILTGLTVGKLYCVSVKIEEYTETASAYIGFFYGTSSGTLTGRMAPAGDAGPGVYQCEFVATATSHSIIIQDDTYSSNSIVCTILEVDVRLGAYGLRVYQEGSAITHGATFIQNLRIILDDDTAFGGLRLDSLNHSVIENPAIDGFTYGPAIHLCNLYTWSENNSILKPKAANCRESIRCSRPSRGSGTGSFSRTRIKDPVYAGCRYLMVVDHSCAFYDSEVDPVSGNMTSVSRAVFSLHGDFTDTKLHGARVETSSLPSSSGIIEYGRNDLRRPWIGHVSADSPQLIADGSFAAGTSTLENVQGKMDFRPNTPYVKALEWREKSGANGTGLYYSVGGIDWHELILDCVSGTAYSVTNNYKYSANHGILEIDAHIRVSDGSAMQGATFSGKYIKGSVYTTDGNKTTVYEASKAANDETITFQWPTNGAPNLTFTYSGSGTATNRSLSVFVRWKT